LDVACSPADSDLRKIDVGIARMVHVFAHRRLVVQLAARFRLIEMNLYLLLDRRRQILEFLFGEHEIEQRMEFPDFGSLGDEFPGEDSKTVDGTLLEIGGYYDHVLPDETLARLPSGIRSYAGPLQNAICLQKRRVAVNQNRE